MPRQPNYRDVKVQRRYRFIARKPEKPVPKRAELLLDIIETYGEITEDNLLEEIKVHLRDAVTPAYTILHGQIYYLIRTGKVDKVVYV